MSKTMPRKAPLFLAVVLVVSLGFLRTVRANGLPPPDVWWFTFETGRPKGVQVIGCDTASCEQPALLQQFGSCRAPPCLLSEPTLSPWSSGANWLKCAGDRCRFANYYAYQSDKPYGTQFKLVAQFSDRAWVSDVLEAPRDRADNNTVAWRVAIENDALVLALDSSEEAGGSPWVRLRSWLRSGYGHSGLFFTQLVELPIAALFLGLRFRRRDGSGAQGAAPGLAKRVLMVFLINLVTFPVVWLFFPSLGRFQPTHVRVLGIAGLALATLYGALLVLIYTTERGRKRSTRILTLVSLPLALLGAGVIWVLVAYGAGYQVAAMGLPAAVIVPVAELFAVLCEAALLIVLHKGTLRVWRAGVTSLLMNATSFVLSLVVLGIWP